MIDCSFKLNNKPMSTFKMGAPSFPEFSGLDKHVNNSKSQCSLNKGPIPKGSYYIFDRQSSLKERFKSIFNKNEKDAWFALYAIDTKIDDETYCEQVKRGQFRLHPSGILGISQGCITINDWTDFQVVRSLLKGTKTIEISDVGLECYGKVRVW
ncbi:MAG: DUF2778 domain-containing protein [Thiotrichaceae bacterium]|nr:DUF2778 domain-containing protein [Thiotrichaceae bacterium]MBL1261504.1 DUF2778 domain-containing protein [Thiotrichaceae bacterium]